MARYGPPDNPDYSDNDPTAYGNYGGHGEPPGPPPEESVPWYRKPAALVAFGALGAVLVALIVWGLASLISGPSSDTAPASVTPITPTSAPPTRTVTETATPTTTEPTTTTTTTTTTEPTTTTTTTTTEPTTSVSTSTVTETQTETETITVPTIPSPPGG